MTINLILIIFRGLLLICVAMFLYLPIANSDCEELRSDCDWDDKQKQYICNIVGTHSDVTIRRLPFPRYVTDIDTNVHIAVPDTEVFWNDEYILLLVSGPFTRYYQESLLIFLQIVSNRISNKWTL